MHLGADYCRRTEQASIITDLVSTAVQDHPDKNGMKPERKSMHIKQSEKGNGRSGAQGESQYKILSCDLPQPSFPPSCQGGHLWPWSH